MKAVALICVLSACAIASCGPVERRSSPDLYEVTIESGVRQTASGDRVAYDLFIPQVPPDPNSPPSPAVILVHGFARDRTFHRNNALYMAQRGIVVLTPNMTSLMGGDQAQSKNVSILVDHVEWLSRRSATPGDALAGILDARRIGLAGHSAGGAVSFEAAAQSQQGTSPVAALCLLDAVPWNRTIERAADLKPLAMVSLRSEPAPWNAQGRVVALLDRLSFAVDDVRIVGAAHCDPENPTDTLGPMFTGGSTEEHRSLYQLLMCRFFRDALKAPAAKSDAETYVAAIEGLQAAGKVVVTNRK